MDKLIKEINNKLKDIIIDLEDKLTESDIALTDVQSKIDEKIDEAKSYKIDVDNARERIRSLDDEIHQLESDLTDLTERFGNKDFSSIIDAGNKEINSKITVKQTAISRLNEQIDELTEKARTIKDLLISLKKDKEEKENKYRYIKDAQAYYKLRLTKIVDYAVDHSDSLGLYQEEIISIESTHKNNKSMPNDTSPIFDEIESMDDDSEDSDDSADPQYVKEPDFTEAEELKIENNSSKADFKSISDSIDKEYANIFGTSEDIKPLEEKENFEFKKNDNNYNNIFDQYNIDDFTINNETEKPVEEKKDVLEEKVTSIQPINDQEIEQEDDVTLVNFFSNIGVDYYSFKLDTQNKLKSKFKADIFNKIVDVLNKNNINLKNIYESPNVLTEIAPSELDYIITKLITAGQNTENIGYILNSLPLINSFDLNEVIKSYGVKIKDANIADIIIKAKHLSEVGGNR